MSERTRPASAFDEQQVAEILRRTAALDHKRKLERPTLTLEEIEHIARESGMDPALVRQAAAELSSSGPPTLAARLAGTAMIRTFERTIEGELTTDDHEAIAATIQAAVQEAGAPRQIAVLGRSMSLATMLHGGLLDVQVTPKDGRTSIRVTVNYRQLGGALFGGLIGGIGGGLGSNVAWLVPFLAAQTGASLPVGIAGGVAGALATVVGVWAVARAAFSGRAKKGQVVAEQLADALESRLLTTFAARAGVTPVSK